MTLGLPEVAYQFLKPAHELLGREQILLRGEMCPEDLLEVPIAHHLDNLLGRLLGCRVQQALISFNNFHLSPATGDKDETATPHQLGHRDAEVLLRPPVDAVPMPRHQSHEFLSRQILLEEDPRGVSTHPLKYMLVVPAILRYAYDV